MKKLPSLILFIFLCFSSCNFFMQEEYGELVIDLEGSSSRAIGSNGLPEIASSELYLQIIGERSGIIEKKFEAGTPKFFSENFPNRRKTKNKGPFIGCLSLMGYFRKSYRYSRHE